jgi:hypothetical protein
VQLQCSEVQSANPTVGNCIALPANCGTTANSTCCPHTFTPPSGPSQGENSTGYNPTLQRVECPKGFFCERDEVNGPNYPGSDLHDEPTGFCIRNAPGCGQLGKPCCINRSPTSGDVEFICKPDGGKKGYWATAAGLIGNDRDDYKIA